MDTALKISPERFREGMTLPEYIRGMGANRETFIRNHDNFTPSVEDTAWLRGHARSRGPGLKVLVLAEDWCSDVLLYVPALARLAEIAGNWDVRVFYRDANHDLADLWLKDGHHRAIPVIVFFDEVMNELACFIERPSAVYESRRLAREAFVAEHTHLRDAALPAAEMSEGTYNLYAEYMTHLRANEGKQWQQLFVDELREKLAAR